jgi:hypothetical protein
MLKTIKTTLIILTLSFVMIANAQAAEPEVKKSKTNICHVKGSRHYINTKNFTPFSSLEECVASGGRAAKPLNSGSKAKNSKNAK